MTSRTLGIFGIATLTLAGLGLMACSSDDSSSLDDGSPSFTPPDGTEPAPTASSTSTKLPPSTPAPAQSSATPPADAGPQKSTTDACAALATCCSHITKPVAKLLCTTAADSKQEGICQQALGACEGADGGS